MFTEDLNVLKCNQRIFFTDTIPDVRCIVGKKKAADFPGDKILHCKSGTNLKHGFCCVAAVTFMNALQRQIYPALKRQQLHSSSSLFHLQAKQELKEVICTSLWTGCADALKLCLPLKIFWTSGPAMFPATQSSQTTEMPWCQSRIETMKSKIAAHLSFINMLTNEEIQTDGCYCASAMMYL